MHIAIITFQGFNELDSLMAFGVLNRIKGPDWRVTICCPEPEVTSMNGMAVRAQSTLEDATSADAVIVGSGAQTRQIIANSELMDRIALQPDRQLIASQCSGALILAKLGLLAGVPVCTDLVTKPWVQEAGVKVLDQPFFAQGNLATAGGCLASSYLAGWIIARSVGLQAAAEALRYVAPVGEKEAFVANAMRNIEPYLPEGVRNKAACIFGDV
ncbi:MAG TPA: DJ-1/PfpI family protein [Dyella sp.]|nr:DJ-1/PfpI family protein [Dyella sp.]